MKKSYLRVLPAIGIAAMAMSPLAHAAELAAKADVTQASTAFTPEQVEQLDVIITTYLQNHPDVVLTAVQAGAEKKEKDAAEKMQQAVKKYKDIILKDKETPILGNAEGTQSLVIFFDPYCGYCRKLHKELGPLLASHKDLKVLLNDIPIMGPQSVLAVQALLAAKEQGKYDEFQNALFALEKPASGKQLLKIAKSLGLDTKQFKADMKGKVVKERIKHLMKLTKDIGITGTPTLIVNEIEVVPGYMPADALGDKLDGKKPKEDDAEEKK